MASKEDKAYYDEVFESVAENIVRETKAARKTITAETQLPYNDNGEWIIINVAAEFGLQVSLSSWVGLTAGELTEMVIDALEGDTVYRYGIMMS